jgi:hypothetical protein
MVFKKTTVIYIVIFLTLISSSILINKLVLNDKNDITSTSDIKSKVLVELVRLNSGYNDAILENSIFSIELTRERDKIIKLMELINKSEIDNASSKIVAAKINHFKKRLNELKVLIAKSKKG